MTSGYAIATLVVFILSIFFVIRPVSIPTPRHIPRVPLNFTTAPILAIALLWAAQCLDPADIRNGIVGTEGVKPYNILILFFSLAYMAITLDVTGILRAAAFWVSNRGGRNGWKLYLYFYIMLTLLSILLGNDPVILSGTAFLVYYTEVAELDWRAWIMAEFAAANTASMVLFVGNPTNVVICEGFGVNNAAFTAYTILPFLACILFSFVALALQYRKQVPRKLTDTAPQDPRAALLDPVGAWVGSFMLGTTLVLCLVVSFFGIDVWMISLPFAVAKFIFDLGWDHYRYSRRIPMLDRRPPKAVEASIDGVSVVEELEHAQNTSENRSPSFPLDEETALDPHSTTLKLESKTDSLAAESLQRTEDGVLCHPSPSVQRSTSFPLDEETAVDSHPTTPKIDLLTEPQLTFQAEPESQPEMESQSEPQTGTRSRSKTETTEAQLLHIAGVKTPSVFSWCQSYRDNVYRQLDEHFPTFMTALPRLPFALVPFAFSQFILIEALNHQGWVTVFGHWLVRASHKEIHPTIWLIGVLGVVLCNIAGTNIGATILLTKVVRAAALPPDANRAAAIALAVASNIGAVSFTFSASLAGLLWRSILEQKGIHVRQRDFALWNLLPLLAMTSVGLGVVSAEMAVLYQS